MFSQKLILFCLVASGLYLLVASLILSYVGKKFHLSQGIAKNLLESTAFGWSVVNFLMEGLFYVAIPTLVYSFFYLLVPLSGIRAGMAAALFAFTIGAAPALMSLAVRIKLPMPFILFLLLSQLLKLGGSLIIISYLYAL